MKKHLKKKTRNSVTVVLDSPVDSSEVRLRLSSREEFNFVVEMANDIGVPAVNIFSDCAEIIKRHGGDISGALSHCLAVVYTLADCRRAKILEGSNSQ